MTASSKQVAMRTKTNADKLKLVLHDAVNQDKVWLDMAIAIAGVVSGKRMVAQRGRKGLLRAEKINDSSYLLKAFTAPDSKFEVARELLFEDCGEHDGQSSMSNADLSISSTLLNGPYEGSNPAISRSRTARVSALGMCSSSSGNCMGNGKPRCSIVCMSRIFMPVDVDMPSREKSLSARRLISGFTRNAIVAEFIGNRFLLFDNGEQYSTYGLFAQESNRNGRARVLTRRMVGRSRRVRRGMSFARCRKVKPSVWGEQTLRVGKSLPPCRENAHPYRVVRRLVKGFHCAA